MVAKIGRYTEAISAYLKNLPQGISIFFYKIGGGSEIFQKPAASLI
jgi:hypothetical protein